MHRYRFIVKPTDSQIITRKPSSYRPSTLWSWCLCPLIDFLFDAHVLVHFETTDSQINTRQASSYQPFTWWSRCLCSVIDFVWCTGTSSLWSQQTARLPCPQQGVLVPVICLVISVSLSSDRFFCLMHRYRFIVKPTDSQITTRQAVFLSAICLVSSVSLFSDFLVDWFIVKPRDNQITTRQAVFLSAICLVFSVSRLFCLMHRYRFIVKPTDSQITTRQAVL